MRLKNRTQLADLLHDKEYKYGAEIGVFQGVHSKALLERVGLQILYCIDPWVDYRMVKVRSGEHNYAETLKLLEPFGNRVNIMRLASLDAVSRFQPHMLDFVYIDAKHDYVSVKDDILNWLPKIRKGGMIAGHDYHDKGDTACVKTAVDEAFGDKAQITVHGTKSWFVQL